MKIYTTEWFQSAPLREGRLSLLPRHKRPHEF